MCASFKRDRRSIICSSDRKLQIHSDDAKVNLETYYWAELKKADTQCALLSIYVQMKMSAISIGSGIIQREPEGDQLRRGHFMQQTRQSC